MVWQNDQAALDLGRRNWAVQSHQNQPYSHENVGPQKGFTLIQIPHSATRAFPHLRILNGSHVGVIFPQEILFNLL